MYFEKIIFLQPILQYVYLLYAVRINVGRRLSKCNAICSNILNIQLYNL